MKYIQLFYKIFLFGAIGATSAVYYWSIRYFIEATNPLRSELIIGETLMIFYTFPLWLGLPVFSFILYKYVSKKQRIIACVPLLLIIMPTLIRLMNDCI